MDDIQSHCPLNEFESFFSPARLMFTLFIYLFFFVMNFRNTEYMYKMFPLSMIRLDLCEAF